MPEPRQSETTRHAPLDSLAEQLASLGAETDTERAVKRIAPWIVSLGIHVGVLVLGFLFTWTVVLLQPEEEQPVIVADFNAMAYDPVVMMDLPQSETLEQPLQDQFEVDSLEDSLEEQLTDIELDPLSMISNAASRMTPADFAPQPVEGRVEFVGLSTSNAKNIVYVIDASGSMIASLQIVLEELARSLEGLTTRQNFGIVFFQRNEAVVVPPTNRLAVASPDQKVKSLQWIKDNIIPEGRSNPLAALEKAMSFKPDAIFLLSENITGAGQYEIDQGDLLALLDQLNPVDARSGRRKTIINCIQFLDPDPLNTLKKIAEQHGGPRGFKFLDRRELGVVS